MKKIVLITGANGHLGSTVARHFYGLGWEVIGMVSKNSDSDRPIKGITTYTCDLLDETETQQTIDSALNEKGMPDMSVFTAGGFAMGNLGKTSGVEIDKLVRLNFHTAYNPARILIQRAQSFSGKIKLVFVGARPGLYPELAENMIAYGLSKSMLISFANLVNKTDLNKHARASVLIPSIIDSPANRQAMPKADFSTWLSPEQIARTISSMSFDIENIEHDFIIEKFAD